MTSYDLYGGHQPAVALASLSYAFESSHIARFIMYICRKTTEKIHNSEPYLSENMRTKIDKLFVSQAQ